MHNYNEDFYHNLMCIEWKVASKVQPLPGTPIWCCGDCHYGVHFEKFWREINGQQFIVCCVIGRICLKTTTILS